jgi:two-component system, NarL family, response regulator DevR
MTISVLLVDHSETVRKAIAGLLRGDPEIQIVAEASSLTQTTLLLSKLGPKIVLMDVHLADAHIVTSSEFKSSLNGSSLLAISIWNDNETKALADSYGALEFLDKANLAYELIPAIKRCVKK